MRRWSVNVKPPSEYIIAGVSPGGEYQGYYGILLRLLLFPVTIMTIVIGIVTIGRDNRQISSLDIQAARDYLGWHGLC